MAIRNSAGAYPPLAICCAALVLFAIAATIVLALIPLYLPPKPVTVGSVYAFQKQVTYSVEVPDTVATGKLSDSEAAQLTETLQSSQTGATKNSGNVKVISAEVVDGSGRKRRQGSTKTLIMIIIVSGQTNTILILLENHLTLFIQQSSSTIVVAVVSIINSRTTTISPGIITTTTVSSGIVNTTTVPSGILSTTTVPSGILSTTTLPPGIVSTTTLPPGILSTTMVGRRRRQVYEGSSTLPLVTYKD